MFATPTPMHAPGSGLTRQYVYMKFVRVKSVASFQHQQYLYMEYIYLSLYDILELWLPSLFPQ